MRTLIGLVLPGLLLFSCGGGGSSAQSTCQQIGTIACQKACDCQDGPGCAMTQDGLTVTFQSQSDCLGINVTFGCAQGDMAAYNDAAACLPLMQAATCTGSGTDGALSYPSDNACQAPPSP